MPDDRSLNIQQDTCRESTSFDVFLDQLRECNKALEKLHKQTKDSKVDALGSMVSALAVWIGNTGLQARSFGFEAKAEVRC